MIRINTLTLSALILSASLVHAQTGPTGPVSPTPPNTNNKNVPQHFTPERADNYLRGKGHTTKMNRHPNGVVVIHAQVQQDGWRFDVEVEFGSDQKNFNLVCKLGSPQSQFSTAQLLALLKKNYDMSAPMHFGFRDGDRQLVLDAPLFQTNIVNDAIFQSGLNMILKVVRETHPLWDTSRWPMTQVAGPVPTPNDGPSPVPPPQPTVTSLVSTTWVGTETLENYGRLEFRFGEGDKVIMIDTAGQTEGTYTVQGNQVTLTFGGCVYTGTINGNAITGMAQQKGQSWTFSVSR